MSQIQVDKLFSENPSGATENILLNDNGTTDIKGNVAVTGNVTVTGTIPANKLTGALPAISGASLTNLPASGTATNLIINGAMRVAQRGTSSTTNGYGSVDRYAVYYGGTDEAPTHAQITLTSSDTGPWAKGFSKALQITNGNQTSGVGADDYIEFRQNIEGQDICNSGWVPTDTNSKLTISYWAKSSKAQTFYGGFRAYASSQYEYIYSFALSANTWTKVTHSVPGNSNFSSLNNDNTNGIWHTIKLFHGTNQTNDKAVNTWAVKDNANKTPNMTSSWYAQNDATFATTGWQLEVGDTATEFEHRSYADELFRCQRYCYKIHAPAAVNTTPMYGLGYARSNDAVRMIHPYPREMRTAPSLSVSDVSHFKVFDGSNSEVPNAINLDDGSAFCGNLSFESSGTSMAQGRGCQIYGNSTNAGFLLITAEL